MNNISWTTITESAFNITEELARGWEEIQQPQYHLAISPCVPIADVQVIANYERKTSSSAPIAYYLNKGESLQDIADKFNINISDIIQWNDLHLFQPLYPRQKLKLYLSNVE